MILECLVFPFNAMDKEFVATLDIPPTIELLISWIKGNHVHETINTKLNYTKLITGLRVVERSALSKDDEFIELKEKTQPQEDEKSESEIDEVSDDALVLHIIRGKAGTAITDIKTINSLYETTVGYHVL
jgi:hypothetical protein